MKSVKKHEEEVRTALEHGEKEKESDYALYFRILINRKVPAEDTSAADLLRGMDQGKYPSIQSISRCRRHLQSKYPDLRGTNYEDRRRKQEEIKEEMSG